MAGLVESQPLVIRDLARVPLLTDEEEVELFQGIEAGRMAREELAAGNVSPRRRMELRHQIEDGWSARNHLITANSRLVTSVVKKYMGRGVPFLDLIQEGNLGLMRAIKKFDHRSGHRFSTYAAWWVRQAVTRAIADQGRTIRAPLYVVERINKLRWAERQLTQRLGRNPTVDELANTVGVSPEKVENMREMVRHPLSLETPTDDEGGAVLGDFIEDTKAVPPDDAAAHNLLREDLSGILDSLPPREARILQLRYGLLDGQAHTKKAVSRMLGLTREGVRQIETKALERLRRDPTIRQKLRDYLGE